MMIDKDNNIVLLDYYETGEATQIGGIFSDCLMNQIEELEDRKTGKLGEKTRYNKATTSSFQNQYINRMDK